MTGNWGTRSINNSISNSSSGDLLFVCLALIELFAEASKDLLKHQKTIDHKTSSSLLLSSAAAKFLFSSCCCCCLNFMLLLRKLLLTPIRLIKLSLKKKIPYNIVRKSWINFTWYLVVGSLVGSHVEKSC